MIRAFCVQRIKIGIKAWMCLTEANAHRTDKRGSMKNAILKGTHVQVIEISIELRLIVIYSCGIWIAIDSD